MTRRWRPVVAVALPANGCPRRARTQRCRIAGGPRSTKTTRRPTTIDLITVTRHWETEATRTGMMRRHRPRKRPRMVRRRRECCSCCIWFIARGMWWWTRWIRSQSGKIFLLFNLNQINNAPILYGLDRDPVNHPPQLPIVAAIVNTAMSTDSTWTWTTRTTTPTVTRWDRSTPDAVAATATEDPNAIRCLANQSYGCRFAKGKLHFFYTLSKQGHSQTGEWSLGRMDFNRMRPLIVWAII